MKPITALPRRKKRAAFYEIPPIAEPVQDPDSASTDPHARSNLFQFVILGAVIAVTLGVMVYLATEVRGKLAELSSSPQDNVQWGLAQFEVEYLGYTTAIVEAHAEVKIGATPDDASLKKALARLRRSYDIIYSRVYTVRDSAIYGHAFANDDLADLVDSTGDKILAEAEWIDRSDTELVQALPILLAETGAIRNDIRRIMTFGNQALTRAADQARRDVALVLQRLAIATGVLMATLTTIGVLFRRMARVSDIRLRENLVTSERLARIFSTSRDAIAVIDRNGRLVSLNDAGETMFAVDEAEARGRRIGTFLRRQDGPNLNRVRGPELFAASKSDRKTGLRLMGVPREGAEFPVEISVDVTRDRLPICVCVIRDISHQIAVEAALKESRDRALAGERAKARFLGVVSHEMRTPLNGIMGTIDLIDEDAAKPGATAKDITQNYLPVLRGSSETLLNLVNDVLDITQIEGGVRISKAPFDLDSLIENLAANETARARDQGNTIDIIIDKPTGSVMGDGARIRQVLSNLISNAVKFTRNGRVTIEVTHHPKDQVEIQVIDTGMGMSEADLARVFDDFTRTDRAVEAQIQGTGLGLGIARTLVEAMEGEIGVESEEGEGSLFWVRLPLPPSADQTAEPAPSESTQNEPCPIPACHVLVVEDNGTNRFIARRLLENDGHSVVEAADGQAGLDAALNQKFDLILMDISMPIMDGIEAAKRIRATPGPNQSTRIVALTAHLSGGYGRQGDMSVMDHILHKPLQRDALRDDLARACGIVDCPGPKPVEPARIAPQSPIDELIASTDPATAQRLIRAFIDEADSTLPDLKTRTEALEDRPNMRLAEDLHALGGVAASFGARSLHLALIQAETAERSGHYEKSAELVAEAADIWPDVRRELQSKLPA